MPCSECERRTFYRIELLGESNTCPRCGAPAYATAARRSQQGEPEWFYDLHGAVRELHEQNGDVPFLAGMTLAATARSFEDIPELDFRRPDQDPDEIDIVALADGQLTIGEAKCVASHQARSQPGDQQANTHQRPPRRRRDPARHHSAGTMEQEGDRPVAEGSSRAQMAVREIAGGPSSHGPTG